MIDKCVHASVGIRVNSLSMDLHHHIAPGVLNIKEMKSLFIFASIGLKATILSFENLQRETLFLHEQYRKYKIFTQQFPLISL